MDDIKILKSNPYKIADMLSSILPQPEINKILSFAYNHVKMLMKLATQQLNYAKSIKSRKAWRQKISRAYYACYNASKAIRLADSGYYSQESSDHKKIGELPNTFNNKTYWEDFLKKFRSDRNLADYDHVSLSKDLEYSPTTYLNEATNFINEARNYLINKGIL